MNMTLEEPMACENAFTNSQTFTKKNKTKQLGQGKNSVAECAIKYDWENRWLNGPEYAYILSHAELYSATYSFPICLARTHPKSTYNNPKSFS